MIPFQTGRIALPVELVGNRHVAEPEKIIKAQAMPGLNGALPQNMANIARLSVAEKHIVARMQTKTRRPAHFCYHTPSAAMDVVRLTS
jgi:hypothetical protein